MSHSSRSNLGVAVLGIGALLVSVAATVMITRINNDDEGDAPAPRRRAEVVREKVEKEGTAFADPADHDGYSGQRGARRRSSYDYEDYRERFYGEYFGYEDNDEDEGDVRYVPPPSDDGVSPGQPGEPGEPGVPPDNDSGDEGAGVGGEGGPGGEPGAG